MHFLDINNDIRSFETYQQAFSNINSSLIRVIVSSGYWHAEVATSDLCDLDGSHALIQLSSRLA